MTMTMISLLGDLENIFLAMKIEERVEMIQEFFYKKSKSSTGLSIF